jgi:hypothetical protein
MRKRIAETAHKRILVYLFHHGCLLLLFFFRILSPGCLLIDATLAARLDQLPSRHTDPVAVVSFGLVPKEAEGVYLFFSNMSTLGGHETTLHGGGDNDTKDGEGKKQSSILLAIVGYRKFNNYARFSKEVDDWIALHGKPETIISGGCQGADKMAERYAKQHSVPMQVLHPDKKRYPNSNTAFAMRDREIAKACTHMLAFPSVHGRGTQLTIGFAKTHGKKVKQIDV